MDSFVSFYVDPATQLYNCINGGALTQEAILKCATVDSHTASFAAATATGLFCFVASFLTRNDSWVDRLWSIVPVVWAWMYAFLPNRIHSGAAPATIDSLLQGNITTNVLFAALITLWGIRLSYNFFRKGGYSYGEEDYRWHYVRQMAGFRIPVLGFILYTVFSFGFISIYQQWLLWIITTPLSTIAPNAVPNVADFGIATLFLVFLTWETTADQQQWNFQNEKRNVKGFVRTKAAEADYKRGFRTRGLWALSRKPNVWSEIQMWVVIFGASIQTMDGMNVTAAGFLNLAGLLIPAAFFTESITSAKYPAYRIYKRHVPMFVPRLTTPRVQLDADFAAFDAAMAKKGK